MIKSKDVCILLRSCVRKLDFVVQTEKSSVETKNSNYCVKIPTVVAIGKFTSAVFEAKLSFLEKSIAI